MPVLASELWKKVEKSVITVSPLTRGRSSRAVSRMVC